MYVCVSQPSSGSTEVVSPGTEIRIDYLRHTSHMRYRFDEMLGMSLKSRVPRCKTKDYNVVTTNAGRIIIWGVTQEQQPQYHFGTESC
jgi:hypothetical protein